MAHTGLVRALVLYNAIKNLIDVSGNFFQVLLVTPKLDGGLLRLPGDGSLDLSDCSQCNPRPWWLKIRSPPRRQVVDRDVLQNTALLRGQKPTRARGRHGQKEAWGVGYTPSAGGG